QPQPSLRRPWKGQFGHVSQVYDTSSAMPLPNQGNINIHDPNVLNYNGEYYLFRGDFHIPFFKSYNMSGPWEEVGTVLQRDSIIEGIQNRSRPWAPTTIERNGTFYCYYALSTHGSRDSAIGVATATALDGSSWTDHGAVIRTGKGKRSDVWPYNITNAIDASFIFDNATGKPYLNFGSYWHDIWQVPLSDDLLSVEDADAPDAVQLTFMPDQKQKPEEGSWMSYRDGYYYAWFSHGACCQFIKTGFPPRNDEYSIRVGRSKNVRGPFLDKSGQSLLEGGGTTVYESNHGEVYAPGGLGVLAGNDSVPDILYYHYLNTSIGFTNEEALLGWNFLNYTSDGWPVVVDGIDISSGASIRRPRWLSLTIVLGAWLYIWS
ncbi:hypothetical protein N7468_009571, partial [Penicillium chermesinum]